VETSLFSCDKLCEELATGKVIVSVVPNGISFQ
jgi:hypothetical protein